MKLRQPWRLCQRCQFL